jgi:transcriptional regulator with XRE-family HTH domain
MIDVPEESGKTPFMTNALHELRARQRVPRKAKNPSLAELLAWGLERHHQTPAQFSRASGVDPATLSNILNWKTLWVTEVTQKKLCDAIGCSAKDMLAAIRRTQDAAPKSSAKTESAASADAQ